MPENVCQAVEQVGINQPVCIHTRRITDSCLDKDCIEDLRVYLTTQSQAALDGATTAKTRCAELLYTSVDVQPLPYKAGHYSVDLIFYYRILGDAILGGTRPTTVSGLAVFSKRVVLYGGCHQVKTFYSSNPLPSGNELLCPKCPEAIVEALDPMILSAKVREVCECQRKETELKEIPANIIDSFGEQLVLSGESKRLYVTIGQFSTVRLERDVALTISACEYCVPTRECCDEECCEEDPCELFSRIDFPVKKFFPESRRGQCCEEGIQQKGCGCC